MLIPVQFYKGTSKAAPEKGSFDPISLVFISLILEISWTSETYFSRCKQSLSRNSFWNRDLATKTAAAVTSWPWELRSRLLAVACSVWLSSLSIVLCLLLFAEPLFSCWACTITCLRSIKVLVLLLYLSCATYIDTGVLVLLLYLYWYIWQQVYFL
jgi:hypothetical protein